MSNIFLATPLYLNVANVHRSVGGLVGMNASYQFECTAQEGALLVLMDNATKTCLEHSRLFEEYMLRYHEGWCDYATSSANLGLRLTSESIILVRGTVKTSTWAIAAFFDAGSHAHEVMFNGGFGQVASIGLAYSQHRGTLCSFEQRTGMYKPFS